MPDIDGERAPDAVAADTAAADRHRSIAITVAWRRLTQGCVAALRERLGVSLVPIPLVPIPLVPKLFDTEERWAAMEGTAGGLARCLCVASRRGMLAERIAPPPRVACLQATPGLVLAGWRERARRARIAGRAACCGR
jgi:hypothetical protein